MNMLFAPPPVPIDLRGYQVEVLDKLRDAIRAGQRRVVLVAPTAAGKTEMAMDLIKKAQAKGSRCWFIVDRVSLIDQTSERFMKHGIDHGVIQANHWLTDYAKLVQIASAQTLARRKVEDDLLPDLIIQDEAHCRYKSVAELIARLERSKAVGLTATPFAAGIAEEWDGLVNSVTVNQLLDQKYLTPLKIKACVAPDMNGVKKVAGEYDDEESGARGITIIGDVVNTWIEQTRKFFGGKVKTIVFSPSVKHGSELCKQFQDAGFNFQQISYLDADDDARREKIAEFRKADSKIDGLVSCAVLTKGFDVPDVMCGISCRPYRKSFSSHIQEMGRVMRVFPGKEFGLWLDHSGNAIAFADDTAWLFENGVDSLSSASKKDSEVREPQEKTRKEKFCGSCGMQMAGPKCSCGWTRPERGEIQIVQGELIDVSLGAGDTFKPRSGLRAECLKDPKAIYHAALSYTMATSSKGPEHARKWAAGIFKGIYERWPPRAFDSIGVNHERVTPDQFSLIDREIRRFRKTARRAA